MFSESGFSWLQDAKVETVSRTGPAVWGRAGVSGLRRAERKRQKGSDGTGAE